MNAKRIEYLLYLITIFLYDISISSKSLALNTGEAKIGECVFKSYADIKDLKEEQARIQPLVGKTYSIVSHGVNESYQYTVGICASILESKGAGVYQQNIDEGGKPGTTTHVLGRLSETHIMLGTDWILLEYAAGDSYGTHCGKEPRRSMIMIACDETADDSTPMQFLGEENTKSDECFYLFEKRHKAVCPVPSGGSGLSVGSILCIVFFTVLLAYIIIGFMYQRFVLKSKGIEQFPNYEFWKDFGNLQADGCDLICRTKDSRRLDRIGGLGDDQLDPSEEIRDENLLPM